MVSTIKSTNVSNIAKFGSFKMGYVPQILHDFLSENLGVYLLISDTSREKSWS